MAQDPDSQDHYWTHIWPDPEKKRAAREQLWQDMADFEARGGTIEQVPDQVADGRITTAHRFAINQENLRRRSYMNGGAKNG